MSSAIGSFAGGVASGGSLMFSMGKGKGQGKSRSVLDDAYSKLMGPSGDNKVGEVQNLAPAPAAPAPAPAAAPQVIEGYSPSASANRSPRMVAPRSVEKNTADAEPYGDFRRFLNNIAPATGGAKRG